MRPPYIIASLKLVYTGFPSECTNLILKKYSFEVVDIVTVFPWVYTKSI